MSDEIRNALAVLSFVALIAAVALLLDDQTGKALVVAVIGIALVLYRR